MAPEMPQTPPTPDRPQVKIPYWELLSTRIEVQIVDGKPVQRGFRSLDGEKYYHLRGGEELVFETLYRKDSAPNGEVTDFALGKHPLICKDGHYTPLDEWIQTQQA